MPEQKPECVPHAPSRQMRFASRADLETFLHGTWALCANDSLGPLGTIVGFTFSGAGEAFAAHTVTRWSGPCTHVINEDSLRRPTKIDLSPSFPGSTEWVITLSVPLTGELVIDGFESSPDRISGKFQLVRVAP
jgi:hypothetical protein